MTDTANILSALLETAKRLGATEADAVLSDSTSVSVNRRMGKPESVSRSEESEIGLRVFYGQKQAIVSSSDRAPDALHAECQVPLLHAEVDAAGR